MQRRARHPARLAGLFVGGLCVGGFAAAMLALAPMRGRVTGPIASEATSALLASMVEPPDAAPDAAPRPDAPAPASHAAARRVPAKPRAPAADAAATLIAAVPAGPPVVADIPPLTGSAATVPVAAQRSDAGVPRGPVPPGLAVPSADAAPPPTSAPDNAMLAALLPAGAPAAIVSAGAMGPPPPALAAHYAPSARDLTDAVEPPAKPPAAAADTPAILMAALPSPPAVADGPPLTGSAATIPVAAPRSAAGTSRGPEPASLAVPSTDAAPPPARAPDDTMLTALLPAAAPAAHVASAQLAFPLPALAAHVPAHHRVSVRDVADAVGPPPAPRAPSADAPAILMAAVPARPPAVTGIPPLAGSAATGPVAAPRSAAGPSRGREPAGLAVPGTDAAPPPASNPDDTMLAALLPAAAPAVHVASVRAPGPPPPGLAARYPAKARDVADAVELPAKPPAPAADAPAILMAAIPAGPRVVTGVAPLAGSAATEPVVASRSALPSRGPEPAGLAVPSAETAPPRAHVPDETVLALLGAAAPHANTAPVRAPDPALSALAVRVLLHYPPSARGFANAAMAALEAAGVTEAVAVPVSFEVPSTNVRYFHGTDQAAAEGLASVLGRVAGAPPKARNFTHFSPRPESGTLEVWLAGARS
jgi:hypothetical protein